MGSSPPALIPDTNQANMKYSYVETLENKQCRQEGEAKIVQEEEVWEMSFHTDPSFNLEVFPKLLQERTDQTES